MMTRVTEPTIVLRFRDLVTEAGGTIDSHVALIRSFGETWWGWMKRSNEIARREFFAEVLNRIEKDGTTPAFLFDTDQGEFYRAQLMSIAVAPDGMRMGSPEPEKTPEYYNHGRYAAWFRFRSIEPCSFPKPVRFAGFPSSPNEQPLENLKRIDLQEAGDLKQAELTLWVVQSRQ